MGCYMSMPDNRVYVTEGKGRNFVYASASCQGWRREQEDAEDCIPEFDENASLFILCDGHGGAEVAKYTVEHLPNFIKNHPLYKEGKYSEALEKAFIDFDALLRTGDVMSELHKLAFDENDEKNDSKEENQIVDLKDGEKTDIPCESSGPSCSTAGASSSNNGSRTIVDDVDTDTLRREAQVPLRDLLDEYSAIVGTDQAKRNLLSKYSASPVVRPKRTAEDAEENGDVSPSTSSDKKENQPGPSSSKSEDEPQQGPSTSGTQEMIKEALIRQVLDRYFPDDDSSEDSEFDGEDSSNDEDEDGDDECDDEGGESSNKKLRRKKHKRISELKKRSMKESSSDESQSEDDSEEDEEEDEEDDEDDDDDDKDLDEDAGDEEGDDNDEEDDDSEFDDGNPVSWPIANSGSESRAHKPGLDSGCTVVVALIKDDKIYVASAGDSRCIVILRSGEFVPMSWDHKPENHTERIRISRAGGRVTEGRVNGGLNLSRALGDFTYKSPNLNAKDQMITPCPDVKTRSLDPNEVEYIFLACDGIWNSMKNAEATGFIRKTAKAVKFNLVDICVDLFRKCIAPKTDGDGTGCDNMTCILARFEPFTDRPTDSEESKPQQTGENEDLAAAVATQKRSSCDDSGEMPTKRRCIRL